MRLDMMSAPARLACCAVALLLSLSRCSKSTSTGTPATTTEAPPPTAAAAQVGSVSGTVAGGAIVILEPKTAREFAAPETPVMDQVSLTFIPEMLIVRTGFPVEFRNSDDTLHNVHVGNSDTKEPAFNVAIPTGQVYRHTFPKDGFYHVGCDIHPAMAADILAVSTPFATVAGGDGRFAFTDVAPGPYLVRVFANGAKTERDMEVKSGANAITLAP